MALIIEFSVTDFDLYRTKYLIVCADLYRSNY